MSHLEELYWEYQGLIAFMSKSPATYGLDTKRTEIHNKILSFYPEEIRDNVTDVLHNLEPDMLFIDFEYAIRHHT